MTTPMPIAAAQQILGELNLQASAGKYQHPDDAKALMAGANDLTDKLGDLL